MSKLEAKIVQASISMDALVQAFRNEDKSSDEIKQFFLDYAEQVKVDINEGCFE